MYKEQTSLLGICTIFLGAFLVFLVQPMMGNTLLPHFGGTAAVWNVCLASFQLLLIGGYLYAHMVRKGSHETRKRYLAAHIALLIASSGWLLYSASLRTSLPDITSGLPASAAAFMAVLLIVAVPFIVLSANSSLVQDICGGNYGLYAISNLGSLMGLWAYPFVFERYMTLSQQWLAFAVACFAYTVGFALLTAMGKRSEKSIKETLPQEPSDVRPPKYFHYLLLSALSCFLLNAVSAHVNSDITPIPLIWVISLSVYLLSYIFAFTDKGLRYSLYAAIAAVPLTVIASWHMGLANFNCYRSELLISMLVLFLGGFVVHSRLYALRPAPAYLTRYYLLIAVGGGLGGAFCSFAMPMLSDRIAEYPIAIAAILVLSLQEVRCACRPIASRLESTVPMRIGLPAFLCIVSAAVAIYAFVRIGNVEGNVIKRYRNFYGTGCVAHAVVNPPDRASFEANGLVVNGTTHGFQLVDGVWKSARPTTYYTDSAGGLPFLKHPKGARKEPLRVGLCGMGIGTLATYARPGDSFRFFEINPAVVDVATDTSLFSFVPKAAGSVEIVTDDARRALEKERERYEPKYDILVVDVFNGDSIPPHMTTKEAFELYLDRLEPDGILAFHLSNWHLDLLPIMKSAASTFNLKVDAFRCLPDDVAYESKWAFLSRKHLPEMYDPRHHERIDFSQVRDMPMMTDDKHSLLPYIIWAL